MKDGSLIHNINVLCQKFCKYHYDKYLEKNNIQKLKNDEIEPVVDEMITKEKELELKMYIRKSLKSMYKESYNSFSVENIFTEIFEDRREIIKRVVLEIKQHQK